MMTEQIGLGVLVIVRWGTDSQWEGNRGLAGITILVLLAKVFFEKNG